MTEEEKKIANIKATMAMEGQILEQQDIQVIEQFLNHQMTEKECILQIQEEFRK